MQSFNVSVEQERAARLVPGHVRKFVELGMRAASGDNCQPWNFRWENEHLVLFVNAERAPNPFCSVELDAPTLIAHGALLENMKVAAQADGYEMSCLLFPDENEPLCVARVRFAPSASPQPSPLAAFIEQRCTDRGPYTRASLERADRDALLAAAGNASTGGLALCEDPAILPTLAGILGKGDRLLFEVRALHTFLFEHVRWTRQEIESTRDGLDARNLGLGWMLPSFRRLGSWPLVRFLNHLGLGAIISASSSGLYGRSGAFGLIMVPGQSRQDYVEGGRIFQRVWLTATSRGLSFQPLTALLFFSHCINVSISSEITNEQKWLISDTRRILDRAFPPKENANFPVILFRLGKATGGHPFPSLRRPIEAHFLTAKN